MGDIQFDRGYVNAEEAATGRFGGGGSSAPAEGAEGEFGFDDFLDIINPLQHIPIVSTLYREITGDEISAPARIFGGTLFGGPSGFVSAMVNTVFDEVAGRDLGSSVMALFKGDDMADPQIAQPGGAALTEDQAKALAAVPLITASGSPLAPTALSSAAPHTAPQPEATVPQASTTGAPTNQPGDGAGLLTGQDALNALFHDLRGTGTVAPVQERPAAPARPSSPARRDDAAPAEHQRSQQTAAPAGDPANNPLILAAQTPDAALADRMLNALDKYRAMSQRQQNSAPERAGAAGDGLLPGHQGPPPQ